MRHVLRRDKIEKYLDWKPEIPFEEELQQTINWYENNSGWLSIVRGGEYRSYYERYYENRDSSLHAIVRSEPQPS